MAEYALGDAPRQGAPYPTETTASHYDQTHIQFVGQPHYLLGYPSHSEVGLVHRSTGDLHPPGELSERLSGPFFDHLVELAIITRGAIAVLHELGQRFDIDHVQLGGGAFG
jgi:hypothetical protein